MTKESNFLKEITDQLHRIGMLICHPHQFIEKEEADRINWSLMVFLVLWWCVLNPKQLHRGALVEGIFRIMLSVVLLCGYLAFLVWISGGRQREKRLLNLSLYIHIFYILLNAAESTRLLRVIIFVIGHLYSIHLQYGGFMVWFSGDKDKVNLILAIQLCIVMVGFFNTLMVYVGQWVVYGEKILYYPIIG